MRQRSRWQAVLALVAFLAGPHVSTAQVVTGSQNLNNLVAPIALYPDALVAQILPASTQPLQIVEASRAVAGGQRPSQSVASQWNPSVQALISYPTVLKMMNDKLDWTTSLGQTYVANGGGVMQAIQNVRHLAQTAGNLKTTEQQTVTVQGSGSTSTIIIEPTNPQYIYVPSYNPVTIIQPAPYYGYGWGAPLMTFGVGFAAGAATAYACDWGHYGSYGGTVNINNSYHYNQNNVYAPYNSNDRANYSHYNAATGNSARYNPTTGTHTAYNANTGTYGSYNSKTGNYNTYNSNTGAYNHDGNTGNTNNWNKNNEAHTTSSWNGSGGDAFKGVDGGGWGAQDASNRGNSSWGGGDRGGGGGWGGGGGGYDRGGGGGGGWGGGGFGGRGGGGGGFRGGGFGGGGRRR